MENLSKVSSFTYSHSIISEWNHCMWYKYVSGLNNHCFWYYQNCRWVAQQTRPYHIVRTKSSSNHLLNRLCLFGLLTIKLSRERNIIYINHIAYSRCYNSPSVIESPPQNKVQYFYWQKEFDSGKQCFQYFAQSNLAVTWSGCHEYWFRIPKIINLL